MSLHLINRTFKTSEASTGRRHPVASALTAASLAMTGMLSPVGIATSPSVALADEVKDAEVAVEQAEGARDDVLSRIDSLERELDAAHLAVPVAQENLRRCVRTNYKAQQEFCGYGYVAAILDCDSLDEMTVLMKTHDRMQDRMTSLVGQLTQRGIDLENSKVALSQELEQAEMSLQEAHDALEQRQAEAKEAERQAAAVYGTNYSGGSESGNVTLSYFKMMGVIYQNGYRYTYYEESVLPGPGLVIPGRHHEDGFIMDGDGYICVASNDLPYGTVVPVPFDGRMGKVYDCGCASGTLDIYIV